MKRAAIGVALATAAALASGCRAGAQADPLPAFTPAADARYEVVASADLKWEQLNPARGDASPRAATLWGDRQGNEPTGFLLNPAEGFRSPPHAHNVSYRALVLRGQLHNDDPQAEDQWLPPGSYWTQPKGGVHVTAAKGGQALAYVEIESGPYRVIPPEQAFAAEEAPVNVDAANLVWLEASSVAWLDPSGRLAAEVAFLWGRPNSDQLSGALLRLPKGFRGTLSSEAAARAVVIQGEVQHRAHGAEGATALDLGSGFRSEGRAAHGLSSAQGCVIYLRARGMFSLRSAL